MVEETDMQTTNRDILSDNSTDGHPSGRSEAPGDTSAGVRARLSIREPAGCVVLDTLEEGAAATDISWTAGRERSVEQFRSSQELDASAIFAEGGSYVYRIERDRERAVHGDANVGRNSGGGSTCPCRIIELQGHPILDVSAATNPARLEVTLLLPSPDPIVDIVAALEEVGASVTLECLVRSMPEHAESVVVDLDHLTDRQREVLEVAHSMGYFSYPRGANAGDVAAELGIAGSTFTEHLAAAQRRLLDRIFEGS